MDYLLLVIGLALLLIGANYLVDASVAIAQRARISNFIIGLTIVGMGTSAPELFVSVSAALSGNGDIAMGNVVGSNILNILLILGVTGTICPFAIEKLQRRRDIPFLIGVSILAVLLANDYIVPGIIVNSLSRLDGAFLVLIFLAYLCYVILKSGRNMAQAEAEAEQECTSSLAGKTPWLLWPIAIVSLAALIYGGNLFLDSAKRLASAWGMSDAVISITIVAVGTSLPELITSVIASFKHNPQLALGNIIGSNLFNASMILGTAALVKPLNIVGINYVDYLVMIAAAVALWITVRTFGKNRFDRIEGIIFLVAYIAYTAYLLQR